MTRLGWLAITARRYWRAAASAVLLPPTLLVAWRLLPGGSSAAGAPPPTTTTSVTIPASIREAEQACDQAALNLVHELDDELASDDAVIRAEARRTADQLRHAHEIVSGPSGTRPLLDLLLEGCAIGRSAP